MSAASPTWPTVILSLLVKPFLIFCTSVFNLQLRVSNLSNDIPDIIKLS